MLAFNTDRITMVRRCLLTFKPFRIFVAGIGFFSVCFLVTSLGGQLSPKRLRDSPFTIHTEVQGGLESRGVLRKISDMLEIILKRIDTLAKLSNTSESHRLEELSSALDRFQPVGLMERIQAIAQNVSDIAVRMDQILQKTGKDGIVGQCEVPKDPRYPDCASKVDWMRARWTSDPCYAFYGVDGSDCSFLIYLSEVEWFCPPLPWRNHSSQSTVSSAPERQAMVRSDLGPLLEQLGSGKESLSFMRRRMRRLTTQWAVAARRLHEHLLTFQRPQKRVLVHVGFLTEESGDVFSPKVLKGGPLGEMVQWADILAALHVLGHNLKISVSVKELQGFLGVPPGRGSCPLRGPLPFDLIYTDYHGLQQMKQHMGLSLKKHKCHIRVIDTFGTEPAYNHEEYATLHGYRTNWGYWNLNGRQYMTMFPHTPDNSFMGFVAEELNQTERISIQNDKVNNMAVVYGKETSMWKGKDKFLTILHRYMDIHGTVYYETQRPPEVPAFVRNHGLLPQHEFQQLLRKAKLFVGFGFPYEGPAPLEAIANGCIFLQPRFQPPRSSFNNEFFRGKPTSREVSSQHPYAEQYIGKPHVITVDYNSSEEVEAAIWEILKAKVEPFLPYEYTCEGMLERVNGYIQHQDFCHLDRPFPSTNESRLWLGNPPSPFMPLPNSTVLAWASNATSVPCWPPVSALRLLLAPKVCSCVKACQDVGLVCEPVFFPFINIMETFSGLGVQCQALEVEMKHVFPAVAVERSECFLQKEPLLFSCAGESSKHRRVCPCRDYLRGQVALCRDCL
ncbi:alpha-1,6-mannosylglycoprotein 6-beta-N-acetylglucosaminyltransferase B-like isoform X1 [Electrophorus electricus]|uniref:alpha-1,6-mannosylglycoprotein 6-beta-N-acetylglucosaminyltransferase B-like isoform X1 n=1 Tax=Electrophorus electricus TaxID=8005 RepID=UPI0015CFDBA3|nr:alpha-1,6-mannosylglycoprotein 6-beta-N-acetylglucosaminyltransferase B-like isoform X1 [Electrophorus electricus]